jgi:hypothetical protein
VIEPVESVIEPVESVIEPVESVIEPVEIHPYTVSPAAVSLLIFRAR